MTEPSSLSVLVLATSLLGCGALHTLANQQAFSKAESLCRQDRQECERQCPSPEYPDTCDYLAVEGVEQDPEKYAYDDSLNQMRRLCQDGIDRACKAARNLAAHVAKAGAARKEAAKAKEQAVQDKKEQLDSLIRRAKEIQVRGGSLVYDLRQNGGDRQEAEDAITIGEKAERNLLDIGACVSPIKTLDMLRTGIPTSVLYKDCEQQFETANKKLSSAQTNLAEAKVQAERVRQAKAEWLALTREHEKATEQCDQDIKACRRDCEADAASFACTALSVKFEVGADVPIDVAKAVHLAQAGCEAGNEISCKQARTLPERAEECSTLEECRGYLSVSKTFPPVFLKTIPPCSSRDRGGFNYLVSVPGVESASRRRAGRARRSQAWA